MKTCRIKQILLFASLWSSLFSNAQAEPSAETRNIEQLRWAVKQLTIIIRQMPTENWELREQAIQRRNEILRELQEQETNTHTSRA